MNRMAGGAHPGRPRVRLRVARGGDPWIRARRRLNRRRRLRPLLRRALRLARHVEHLSADVAGAHAGPRVPHLDERVAGARAPKRLAAITRLARIPAPVRVADGSSGRAVRSAQGAAAVGAPAPAAAAAAALAPAPAVGVARELAPTFPPALDAGGAARVESASENDPIVARPVSSGSKPSLSDDFSPRRRADRSSGSFSASRESPSEPEAKPAPEVES